MNLVELELDETLADFEVQDWIDNVFSVQYPDVKARIKKGCSGLCHKKDEWHYVKDRLPKELHDVLCFVIHNEHRYSLQGYLRDGRWVLSPLGTYLNNEDVIAWKEIVFPKED